jgi:hypothetical protein
MILVRRETHAVFAELSSVQRLHKPVADIVDLFTVDYQLFLWDIGTTEQAQQVRYVPS